MILGFIAGTIFGIILTAVCAVIATIRTNAEERKEQYETGKRESNNSTGLY
jgi:hypothetical protein